ncbi:DNA primase [Pararhizobium mangrovi]|uniref:DNA primase n=1 Tax=Pararhizobium mangrovi TaxID=2590452 RepID=A0A506UBG6_9HYPH|nr:DNA primase [Pararhizobium mangrovi]TPW30354.1 DNA primase [Pararhizobium mangrovi]
MRFSPSFLDDIRERVPISDVIGQRVTWDRRKTNAARGDYWACCPFHGENTPSFHCEDRKGRYYCFGCGVSGDHFKFLSELDSVPFPQAVEQLAGLAGVEMPVQSREEARREAETRSLVDVMEMAAAFFEERLQAAGGARARAYLRSRGLSGRTIATFRLGFAPESRNALKEYLAGKGIRQDQIEACGLVVHGPDIAVSYDRFRNRVMFPIEDSRGRVIAFGGRALDDDAPAKYLNSNETELFHKGAVLYNLARARKSIQGAGGAETIVAVEGYMDVIALHQAGVENAVAPLGTALTERQLEMLWRMVAQPTLCFDGDTAGMRAANRAVDLALPALKPGRSVRFALLPEGRDPDDLVREGGREPFDRVLASARPLAGMLWAREAGSGVFDTPERRAALEARMRQVTATIGDESVRRHYAQEMRERLNAFFATSGDGSRGERGRSSARGERGGYRRGGRDGAERGGLAGRRWSVSERLTRSGIVRGHVHLPPLRESVLALTVVNHPILLEEEFDEIVALEFDDRDLSRMWPGLLGLAGGEAALERAVVVERLALEGFSELIATIDRQVRNARLWTATETAAFEDARGGFQQALALHKRTRALRTQKAELERDIAQATEEGDDGGVPRLMRALQEVQIEVQRLEHQEAIIDGFGTLSGR